MSSLKDRIAALQANSSANSTQPSGAGSRSASPVPPTAGATDAQKATRLQDKIARFNRLGGTPVPRSSFGLGAPPTPDASTNVGSKDYYGNRADVVVDGKPGMARSASLSAAPRSGPRNSFERYQAATDGGQDSRTFETVPQRSRSGSNMSTLSSNSSRPTYLSPNFTGDTSSILSRSSSVPSSGLSDFRSRRRPSSPLAANDALTADAVSKLPTSPSFRGANLTSSIATDIDGRSEQVLNTPTEPKGRLSTAPSMLSSSVTDEPHSYDHPRAQSSSRGSPPSSFRSTSPEGERRNRPSTDSHIGPRPTTPSYYAQLNESSTALSGPDQPRPSTPSYLSQAAGYFPPSKRQSVNLSNFVPPPSNGDADSPTDPSRSPPNAFVTGVAGSKNGTPSASHARMASLASVDSAYYTAESENGGHGVAQRSAYEDADLTITNPRRSVFGAPNGAGQLPPSQSRPSTSAIVTAFPKPPTSISPSPSQSKLASLPPMKPPPTSPLPATPTEESSAKPTDAKNQGTVTGRRKKPKLVPGKWINSDDEDSEDEEAEEGKGWARIIVSSSTR